MTDKTDDPKISPDAGPATHSEPLRRAIGDRYLTYALSTIMFVVILCIILISNAMESRSYRRDQKALRGEGV